MDFSAIIVIGTIANQMKANEIWQKSGTKYTIPLSICHQLNFPFSPLNSRLTRRKIRWHEYYLWFIFGQTRHINDNVNHIYTILF